MSAKKILLFWSLNSMTPIAWIKDLCYFTPRSYSFKGFDVLPSVLISLAQSVVLISANYKLEFFAVVIKKNSYERKKSKKQIW